MANQNFEMPQMPPEVQLIRQHLLKIIVGVFAIFALWTSIHTIAPEEEGVVLRLGEFNRVVQPGLNFIIPFGVEELSKIPVQRQLKMEFGFRTVESGQRTTYSKSPYIDESLMLTGDLNIADVEWVVQYRIENSYNFLFRVRNADETLRVMSESVVRKIVGDRTVSEVLTVRRQDVATRAEELLQQMCDDYENGIRIDQIVLQDVNPPDAVKASFNAVNQAEQQRETLINQAESEYNREVPRARGEARQMVQVAEGYAFNRVNDALGEANRFNSIFSEYVAAPEVTKQRIYLETMETVLPKLGNKVIVDEKGNNVLPLLNIDQARRAN